MFNQMFWLNVYQLYVITFMILILIEFLNKTSELARFATSYIRKYSKNQSISCQKIYFPLWFLGNLCYMAVNGSTS
jgi:hypothetical protein